MGDEKYSAEIRRAFEQDNEDGERIGRVWKRTDEGEQPKDIADRMGVRTYQWVYNVLRCIRAIESGDLPRNAPSVARQVASALRSFSKRHYESGVLSENNYRQIQEYAEKCEEIQSDSSKQKEETQELTKQTTTALDSAGPGIYIYTLPHYFHHPYAPQKNARDRTLLKVGHTRSDVDKRVKAQRTTAIPETPVVLRIFEVPEGVKPEDLEKKIHDHLSAADHHRQSQPGTGQEWFETHLTFLDSIADLLDLKTQFQYDPEPIPS